jgi:hypothetical protein
MDLVSNGMPCFVAWAKRGRCSGERRRAMPGTCIAAPAMASAASQRSWGAVAGGPSRDLHLSWGLGEAVRQVLL